jgi:putative Mn2+ efflux pump MntP
MFGIILLLGLALALDSFAVSISLGATGLSRTRHLWLPLGFGVCDGLASLLGVYVGLGSSDFLEEWLALIGPLAVAAYALYVLVLARLSSSANMGRFSSWLVLGLPLCLSLDNFLTAGRMNTLGLPVPFTAVLFGLCSGLLAHAGLRLGEWGAVRWPRPARFAGAFGLLVVAVAIAVT